MTPIRPFREDDLPQVASLYERVIRSGSEQPAPLLADYFRRTFLDHPWADPEIPSLVYEESGRIVGFLGSHVRRLRFDGEPIRLACSGQLVTAHDARRSAPGAFLLREFMSGPQELTNTDGANDAMLRLWPRLGAEILHLRCIDWIRVFRPSAVALEYASRRQRKRLTRIAAPFGALADTVAMRAARARLRPGKPAGSIEALTPQSLVAHLATIADAYRLYPDYDEAFVEWLFREMAAVRSRGELVKSLVRGPDGRVLGWYVAYLRRGLVSDVVHVAAVERALGTVLDHLSREAFEAGASAIRGRIEPRLLFPLWERRCLLRYSTGALAHSHSQALLHTIRAGRALLTRMEGEWWMGHHLEPFERAEA